MRWQGPIALLALAGLVGVVFSNMVFSLALSQENSPADKDLTKVNKNTLIKKYRQQLQLSASSTWGGWPPVRVIDDNLRTSWFSARNDTAAHGQKPWLEMIFPEDVKVQRVTVLGNREPPWEKGYTILAGRLELFTKGGERLYVNENEGTGPAYDFDFVLPKAMERVHRIRFTALGDQGKQNVHDDIAIGEIHVE